MADLFKDLSNGASDIQKKYLGPDYKYHKFIKNPGELGMSGKGSMSALKKDIAGIINYVDLLISGQGRASKTGRPLGDKFFLQTAGQCTDIKTKKLVPRSIYISNVPSGNINFIPAMGSIKVGSSMKGILPGMMNDIGSINPIEMFGAFMQGNDPPCAQVKLETIDENNRRSKQSAYVAIAELRKLQEDGDIPKNTVTRKMLDEMNASSTTKEGFVNLCIPEFVERVVDGSVKHEDMFQTLYMSSFALLMVYIMYRMIRKM